MAMPYCDIEQWSASGGIVIESIPAKCTVLQVEHEQQSSNVIGLDDAFYATLYLVELWVTLLPICELELLQPQCLHIRPSCAV